MTKTRWKKVLYENQQFPDNYTDDSFLRDLRTNIKIKPISFIEAVSYATWLEQQICVVIMFIITYVYLYNEWVQPSVIFNYFSLVTSLGYILFRSTTTQDIQNKLGHDLRTILIYIVFGYLFSPVLHTLTDTISTDTIYTMSFYMILIHLLFFDYGVASSPLVSNSLSLSAAVFASICLASRLSSAYNAFILITIAVECFVLFPLLWNKLLKSSFITLMLIGINIYFLMQTSTICLILFLFFTIFISIICPILFVNWQKYKSNIYGPWDEAIVHIPNNNKY